MEPYYLFNAPTRASRRARMRVDRCLSQATREAPGFVCLGPMIHGRKGCVWCLDTRIGAPGPGCCCSGYCGQSYAGGWSSRYSTSRKGMAEWTGRERMDGTETCSNKESKTAKHTRSRLPLGRRLGLPSIHTSSHSQSRRASQHASRVRLAALARVRACTDCRLACAGSELPGAASGTAQYRLADRAHPHNAISGPNTGNWHFLTSS